MSQGLHHTLRVMLRCAEIVERVSPAARDELYRHAATLLFAVEASGFVFPDTEGGARDAPAHQGGLPPVAGDDRATEPVNACPGVASDDAASSKAKAADPAASVPRAEPRRGRSTVVSAETLAEIERRWRAGQPTGLIARACGLTPKAVYNMAYKRRWPRPTAAPGPAEAPRRVAEPSVVARELAEAAAAEATAPADDATIREWGRANGVEIDRFLPPDGVAELVNARRRELGLTPFRRVAHPLGALPAGELRRMRAGVP